MRPVCSDLQRLQLPSLPFTDPNPSVSDGCLFESRRRTGALLNVILRSPGQQPTARSRALAFRLTSLACAGGSLLLGACTIVSDGGSRVDYRNAPAAKVTKLDVPPDLTQLSADPRYAPPTGAPVSANALETLHSSAAVNKPAGTETVAPTVAGQIRVERVGNSRWLNVPMTPEQLWPKLRQFWQDNGMALEIDRPEIGLMETGWAENRAKLPQDVVRRTLGKVFDSAFDSGERDRYRTRLERGADGSTEVHISHRGAEEIVNPNTKEYIGWKVRANDPALESEMLARLMLALGRSAGESAPDARRIEAAVLAVNQTPSAPGRARLVEGQPAATIELAEDFDRAWRRVGQALDRGGFTLEDRDRNLGLYFVRYVNPELAGKEGPNVLQRLFGAKSPDLTGTRHRLQLTSADGRVSRLQVLDADGRPDLSNNAKGIAGLLINELR